MRPRAAVFETVIAEGPYRIDAIWGQGGDVVISFASIGHDATRPPSPEFVAAATASGRTALFVSDPGRTWGTAPGFPAALLQAMAAVRARQVVSRVVSIGQSMGGFLALRAAEVLPLDAVLAIGPQSTMDDPRWRDWTAGLRPVPLRLTAPRTVLLHGMLDDRTQAMGFAPRPGLDHFLFADQDHSGLARHLKARGLYAGLIDCALSRDRRRMIRILTAAGGRLRGKA
jgi:pimeloyl-ACP methyl ester carboxylesterase